MVFFGNCPAIVTPFDENGKVDYEEFKRLVDFQISGGASAITFIGTTGECATLDFEEKKEIVKFAVNYVGGRVPVIVGSGSNSTDVAILNSKTFENLGVDALLVVTPFYNKCTQNGLISHYSKIANSVSVPIIMYNVPSRTGVNMLAETVIKLSHVNNIVGLKEASGNIEQTMEILSSVDSEFAVYSGEDSLIFPMLCLGAKGVISVAGNIVPRLVSDICFTFFEGNILRARKLQYKLNPLVKLLFSEVNPIPIKKALELTGHSSMNLRLPLEKMSKNNADKLEACLDEYMK